MITYDLFEKNIKSNKIDNSYIFCGHDEELIKDAIKLITKPLFKNEIEKLNYIEVDGNGVNVEEVINICEIFPFGSEKKVVEIYRTDFIESKIDSSKEKKLKIMKEYLKNIPKYTIIIMYMVFSDKRDKPNKNRNIMALDKLSTVVYCEKLKRDKFLKKVDAIFKDKNTQIGNVELRYFCEKVNPNFDIIKNEIDKLTAYVNEKPISKSDIDKLLPSNSEEDIFDLIDLISQKKIKRAIDVMDEILFKSNQHMLIVISIENQFKKLYNIKIGLEEGKRISDFVSELRLPEFICQKLINLSRKFSRKQLKELIILCTDTEMKLKTNISDKRMELELLLVNTLIIK